MKETVLTRCALRPPKTTFVNGPSGVQRKPEADLKGIPEHSHALFQVMLRCGRFLDRQPPESITKQCRRYTSEV